MRAVFLDYDTVSNGDLDNSVLIEAAGEVGFFGLTAESEVIERLATARIALTNKVRLTRAHFKAAPALELIALAATGSDNVDLPAAREGGIAVCNVRDYCTASVAQHAWSMILCLNQHLAAYSTLVAEGAWAGNARSALMFPIRELAGQTLGVIGWGALGRQVATIAQAFGMRVLIANRRGTPLQPGRTRLDELLESADIVSLHCPLTPETRGLIGARELALMKSAALLINTARGALIDGAALAAALKAGRLGGAGIDVLPKEPPVPGEPLLDAGIPNLIVTPHVAWAARAARQRCLAEMAANIKDFYAGGKRGRIA
jgi:glycerate dehydrogenase